MIYSIIISTQDPAALNIKDKLIGKFKETEEEFEGYPVYCLDSIKMYTTDRFSVYCEGIDKEIDGDMFIFATKHASEGKPTLSVHSPGNWGKAKLGGESSRLCVAPALYLKKAFNLLLQKGLEGFDVSLEQTHHGPVMDKPVMFIEIGSQEDDWGNDDAGSLIADVIIELLTGDVGECESAVLLGGGHYNQSANKVMERTEYAVGHICAKFAIEDLNVELLQEAIDKTVPKASIVLLDWKGLGPYKEKVSSILDEIGVKSERVQRLI